MAINKQRDVQTLVPLGDVVHKLRMDNNRMTLGALAEKSGVSRRTIQEIERSERVRQSTLELVAAALRVPLDAIVFDIVSISQTLINDLYALQKPGALEVHASLFHPDVRFWINGNREKIPFAGEFCGRAGVADFFARLFDAIAPRKNDPPPLVLNIAADHAKGRVVVDIANDLVRLKRNPERTLSCKVKCTFEFKDRQLIYFEDLFDTSAWERFLSSDESCDLFMADPTPRPVR